MTGFVLSEETHRVVSQSPMDRRSNRIVRLPDHYTTRRNVSTGASVSTNRLMEAGQSERERRIQAAVCPRRIQ